MLRPLEPVSVAARIWLGIFFFVLFVAAWSWATVGGYISPTFLADPLTMLDEGWSLLVRHGFLYDIGMTIWRVVGGFVLAAIVAIPLGIAMGTYKPI
jgi:NitT/TauT family transport system permease protein